MGSYQDTIMEFIDSFGDECFTSADLRKELPNINNMYRVINTFAKYGIIEQVGYREHPGYRKDAGRKDRLYRRVMQDADRR